MNNAVLHGCTFKRGCSNFGDYLYARTILAELRGNGCTVRFTKLSEYFKKWLAKSNEINNFPLHKADAVIYIPGGYFIENGNQTIRERLYRYLGYILIGRYAIDKGKPILILGVDAGPFYTKLFRRATKHIFDNARQIVVRNEESKKYLNEIGICRTISVLPDMLISQDYKSMSEAYLPECIDAEKIILIHFGPGISYADYFADVTVRFLTRNTEYKAVVTFDCKSRNEAVLFERFRKKVGDHKVTFNNFDDPDQLIYLIRKADIIVTTKLHVGVVGICCNRSVYAISTNYEKTRRTYNYLGLAERCVNYSITTVDTTVSLIERQMDTPIHIDPDIIKQAKENSNILTHFIAELN